MDAQRKPSTLLGTGIADALGCPFEVPNEAPLVHARLAGWDGSFLSTRGGWHDLEAGQWSDDTQFSVTLAESLLAEGDFIPEKVGAAYLRLYKQGVRGMGGTTKKAMLALESGVSAHKSGVLGSEGNGTAMRAAPIGLFFHRKSLATIMEMARKDARITHDSKEAMEGSAAVAGVVALLAADGGPHSKRRALSDIVYYLYASKVKDRLRQLLVEMKTRSPLRMLADFGTRGHVVQTVPSAMTCFLMTDSYAEAVLMAVRAGGDADTTAAIAGAIAGTCYGGLAVESAFGGAWARDVERVTDLRQLDEKLFSALA